MVGRSRKLSRVLVDAATVEASGLRDRLRLHPLGSAPPSDAVALEGVGASIERGVGRLWELYRPDAPEGPGAMVLPPAFAAALRALVDGLVLAGLESAAVAALE